MPLLKISWDKQISLIRKVEIFSEPYLGINFRIRHFRPEIIRVPLFLHIMVSVYLKIGFLRREFPGLAPANE